MDNSFYFSKAFWFASEAFVNFFTFFIDRMTLRRTVRQVRQLASRSLHLDLISILEQSSWHRLGHCIANILFIYFYLRQKFSFGLLARVIYYFMRWRS